MLISPCLLHLFIQHGETPKTLAGKNFGSDNRDCFLFLQETLIIIQEYRMHSKKGNPSTDPRLGLGHYKQHGKIYA